MPEPDVQRIKAALVLHDEAQQQVELPVAGALKASGWVREVAASARIFRPMTGQPTQRSAGLHPL